jgi:hypothetical protein
MSKSKEQFMAVREYETALSGISFEHLIDAKKSNLTHAVEVITKAITDGEYDSLKGLILAVKGKTFFTDLEKALRPLAENNYLNKLEKNYSLHDVKIDQAATKTEYDFEVCSSPIYERLAVNFATAKADFDAHKDLLKTLTKPMEMIDEETGESFRCMPPNKLQSDGLKLSIR